MKQYLLFCDGVGALIEFDMGKMTSGDFGQIYDAFLNQAGFHRENLCPSVVRMDPREANAGICWDWELAGPDGASYRIHVLPGTSERNIELCKAHIRRSYDCVRLYTNRIKRLIDFSWPVLKHEERK
jgi:hypothetical protein